MGYNYPKMAQNNISNVLNFKIFVGEHASRIPAFDNCWICDSLQLQEKQKIL